MAKGSGGGGGRGGIPSGNAKDGTDRVVGGVRINTADVVNRALTSARVTNEDTQATIDNLRFYGNRNPESDARVPVLSRERAILRAIDSQLRGANAIGQWSNTRWDMSSAQTIEKSLNSYLSRRVSGQRSRRKR